MYSTRSGLILGFHGCDESTTNKVINGKESLVASSNDYDWLGHGVYFWEHSPLRAMEFVTDLQANKGKTSSNITTPSVVGAIIDLGHCLDFTDSAQLKLLSIGYNTLKSASKQQGLALPSNKRINKGIDILLRRLDCAVIETIHTVQGEDAFDSVRGVFWEGKKVYPNAGFKAKNHIQICIRNPNCIKGYFLPAELDIKFKKV